MDRVALLVAIGVVAGCKGSRHEPAPAVAPAAATDAGPRVGDTAVRIIVDGREYIMVDAPRVATWPALESLVIAGTPGPDRWEAIEARGTTTRRFSSPGRDLPGLVPALFPEDGVSLGFFTPDALAAHGRPQVSVARVSDVAITSGAIPIDAGTGPVRGPGSGDGAGAGANDQAGGGARVEQPRPVPDATLAVTVVGPGGSKIVDGATLATLPAVHAPSGDTETTGWDLRDVVAATGMKPTGPLVVRDVTGAAVTIDPAKLSQGMGFLKLNRSGQLRFRMFVPRGEEWIVDGELRGVTTIELR